MFQRSCLWKNKYLKCLKIHKNYTAINNNRLHLQIIKYYNSIHEPATTVQHISTNPQ